MEISVEEENRFWSKVITGNEHECWEWIAHVNNYGYGTFNYKGKNVLAHRFSYEINKGKIENGLYVCHKCDNPKCVNPNHLFLGTHQDNMTDMINKGRSKGEKGRCELTEREVKEIRQRYATGNYKYKQLADEYNISQINIVKIILNINWKHIL